MTCIPIQAKLNEIVGSGQPHFYTVQQALNFYLGNGDLEELTIHDGFAEILGTSNPELKTVQKMLNEYIDSSYTNKYTIQQALCVIDSFDSIYIDDLDNRYVDESGYYYIDNN